MMSRLEISDAQLIAERRRKRNVIILSIGDGNFELASYGRTKRECRLAGQLVDAIHDAICDGVLEVPIGLMAGKTEAGT